MDAGNRDIDQFGDAPPGVTAPACRVREGIVDTGSGAPDSDRAAVPIDNVDRGLRPHGAIAGANDDPFGLEACRHALVPSRSPWRRLGDWSSSYVLDPFDK
jgi:hypothetical protein